MSPRSVSYSYNLEIPTTKWKSSLYDIPAVAKVLSTDAKECGGSQTTNGKCSWSRGRTIHEWRHQLRALRRCYKPRFPLDFLLLFALRWSVKLGNLEQDLLPFSTSLLSSIDSKLRRSSQKTSQTTLHSHACKIHMSRSCGSLQLNCAYPEPLPTRIQGIVFRLAG